MQSLSDCFEGFWTSYSELEQIVQAWQHFAFTVVDDMPSLQDVHNLSFVLLPVNDMCVPGAQSVHLEHSSASMESLYSPKGQGEQPGPSKLPNSPMPQICVLYNSIP